MDRYPKIFTYSIEPGSGKSWFGASLYRSEYLDPTRCITFDNHGSTDALGLHQWSKEEPWGVMHVRSDQPWVIREYLEKHILPAADSGEPRYDAIIFDDMTEHSLVTKDVIDEDNEEGGWSSWQELLSELCATTRMLEPRRTGAALVMVGHGDWLPDPRVKRDPRKKDDTRPRVIRPSISGKYGIWLPRFFDLIAFQHYEPGDPDADEEADRHNDYQMFLRPRGSIMLKNRWEHLDSEVMPGILSDPSFDKLWTVIKDL